MSIENYARLIHDNCRKEKRKHGLFQKKIPISSLRRIFVMLEIDKISGQIVGFIACCSDGGPIRYSVKFLPSRRENGENIDAIAESIQKSGGVASDNPIQFLSMIAKIRKVDGFFFSYPFINFNKDIKWTYDEAFRRCLVRQKIPKTFIILEDK